LQYFIPENPPVGIGKLYLLITRVRDEASYLPELFRSVFSQTIRPNLWVIVDHDSKDESAAIIADAAKGKDWIRVVNVKADEDYGLYSHARPLRVGFETATGQAERSGIPYQYLGILDADITPEPEYFEKLINYLNNSADVGITGGRLFIMDNGEQKPEDSGELPRGGCRLYRRECYESIGGAMPESAIWDTETDVLSELRGWQISTVPDTKAIHRRPTYTRKGVMAGYSRLGACYYYANNHPVSTFFTALYFMIKPPFLTGIIFLASYLKAWICKSEQSTNPEIRDYFWKSFGRLRKKAKNKALSLFNRRMREE
jgi:GT2 family glycosyltransferase